MPPAAYTTLREFFLTRVIRIKAVQDEHAAAIEESRQPGTPVPEDIVELLFDYGFIPGRDKHSSLWPISTAGLRKLPPKLTPALERGLLAALRAWHQLVRELRNGMLIATGERFGREPWRDVDRQEIGLETWLPDPRHLQFDVRTNTVCFVEDDGFSNRTVPVWFEIRVRRADEVAETTEREHALASAPGTALPGRTEGMPTSRRREPSEGQKLRRELFEIVVGDNINSPMTRLLRLCGTVDKPTQAWIKACATKSVDPVDYQPPSRRTIDRWRGHGKK